MPELKGSALKVWLSHEVRQEIERQAAEEGCSLSFVVSRALRFYALSPSGRRRASKWAQKEAKT